MAVADALAPIYAFVAGPLGAIRESGTDVSNLIALTAENARLRQENERLRQWQSMALALDAENRRLKANLHWVPDPAPSFITARVVADAGGVYARAVLLSVGPNHGIAKGEIALDERGLVGRVTEVGKRSARVLLFTDLNSRIPVILRELARARDTGRHQRGPAAPDLLGRGHAASGRRTRRHQRRGQRLSGQSAGRDRPLHGRQCPRGGTCRRARSARFGADLRLRTARHWPPGGSGGCRNGAAAEARADQNRRCAPPHARAAARCEARDAFPGASPQSFDAADRDPVRHRESGPRCCPPSPSPASASGRCFAPPRSRRRSCS